MIRGDAIKLLTDMCQNLNEIFPFLYEIIKGGIHDSNAYVKQISLISLVKLFENTEIQFDDYHDEIHTTLTKILNSCDFSNAIDTELFSTAFQVFDHLNSKFGESNQKEYFETLDKLFYRVIYNLDSIDSLQIYQMLINYVQKFVKEQEIKEILKIVND